MHDLIISIHGLEYTTDFSELQLKCSDVTRQCTNVVHVIVRVMVNFVGLLYTHENMMHLIDILTLNLKRNFPNDIFSIELEQKGL